MPVAWCLANPKLGERDVAEVLLDRAARQRIEATIDALKDQLSLEQHGAHTVQGVWIRVAQRLLASAASVWFNWQLNAAVKRSIVAYDH
jgi:hypothetical protein